jgi:hypothetical protein
MGAFTGQTCADLYFAKSLLFIETNYLSGRLKCRGCLIDTSECIPPPGCYLIPAGLWYTVQCN